MHDNQEFRANIEDLKSQSETEVPDETKEISMEDVDPAGFRLIIDKIKELQIPLITHNGFYDMLHVKLL